MFQPNIFNSFFSNILSFEESKKGLRTKKYFEVSCFVCIPIKQDDHFLGVVQNFFFFEHNFWKRGRGVVYLPDSELIPLKPLYKYISLRVDMRSIKTGLFKSIRWKRKERK